MLYISIAKELARSLSLSLSSRQIRLERRPSDYFEVAHGNISVCVQTNKASLIHFQQDRSRSTSERECYTDTKSFESLSLIEDFFLSLSCCCVIQWAHVQN